MLQPWIKKLQHLVVRAKAFGKECKIGYSTVDLYFIISEFRIQVCFIDIKPIACRVVDYKLVSYCPENISGCFLIQKEIIIIVFLLNPDLVVDRCTTTIV